MKSTPEAAGGDAVLQIVRAAGEAGEAQARISPLLDEYVRWGYTEMRRLGVPLEPAAIDLHHAAFAEEIPHLLGPRGRLLIAELDGRPVGVVGLLPVDGEVAEVKRMFVQPGARGRGIARRLLTDLLAAAGELGYRRVRLETAVFMTEAQALYRSLGFRDVAAYPGAESALSGFGRHVIFLEWSGRRE